uniref:WD repeat-containing protein 89 n=1 Tax=Petromyzon marinus TaxID=7757 RepID=A0AAJ7TJQ2_PETMA|nr:WD repeat-containing protein 89 [Petromyzon marinus]XP_032818655.1 WD repeat-containing protein 89 [Petromyzon marinus]
MEEVLQTMRELRLSRSSPNVTENGSQDDGGGGGGGGGGGSSSYVLGVDWAGERLAAASSDRRVRLFDRRTLRPLAALTRHGGPVVGVRFPRHSHDLLFSASEDGAVRCWDVRLCGGRGEEGLGSDPVAVFHSNGGRALASFDVNAPGSLVCAGTERSDNDAFLTFWDARGGRGSSRGPSGEVQPVGVYEESHSDDITQVCFHPADAERVASGGVDGLVNVFDLRQGSEEDALQATCNSHSSVAALGWCGRVAGGAGPRAGLPNDSGVGLPGDSGGGAVGLSGDWVFCATHTEGLLLWDLEQVTTETDDRPITVLNVPDVRIPEVTGGVRLDYVVDAFYHERADLLFIAGGTHGGDLHLLTPEFDSLRRGSPPLRTVCSLRGGHRATVRCLAWDGDDRGSLVTGGEDGQLVLWRPPGLAGAGAAGVTPKLPSAVHRKGRVRSTAPYKTKRK